MRNVLLVCLVHSRGFEQSRCMMASRRWCGAVTAVIGLFIQILPVVNGEVGTITSGFLPFECWTA